MRKLQIGVIGSMADVKIEKKVRQLAIEVGEEIAKNSALLVFGFEGDFESVSSIAARSAKKIGGQTIAFVWGSDKPQPKNISSIQIVTGQQRGGGREFSLILSCDALICISGGSGTLMEITMAYQAEIPIIALKGTSGWSDKLINQFLDNRRRERVIGANNPKEAVKLAINLAIKHF
jgi:uncharacterized protein (TIGR00725 family)